MAKQQEKQEQGQGQVLEAIGFTEAPASVNFRFDWRGWNVQLTIRDEKVGSALKKMEAAIGHLEGMGAKPLARRGGDGQAGSAGDNSSEAPLCPTHGKPMLPSKKGEGYYCPVKIADDDGTGKPVYCKQRVK